MTQAEAVCAVRSVVVVWWFVPKGAGTQCPPPSGTVGFGAARQACGGSVRRWW